MCVVRHGVRTDAHTCRTTTTARRRSRTGRTKIPRHLRRDSCNVAADARGRGGEEGKEEKRAAGKGRRRRRSPAVNPLSLFSQLAHSGERATRYSLFNLPAPYVSRSSRAQIAPFHPLPPLLLLLTLVERERDFFLFYSNRAAICATMRSSSGTG